MKLSTRSRYAVMAIADMAHHSTGHPISLQQIAIRQNIDLNYLEQIFVALRRNSIVRSAKGPGGGYILNHDAKDIKISDILFAMNDSFKMTRCSSKAGCASTGGKCLTHNLWAGLEEKIMTYLSSVSLYDVANNFLTCHPRESGDPDVFLVKNEVTKMKKEELDSRFRGNDKHLGCTRQLQNEVCL